MIENQQLRWFRTTLLGRTPGWSPPAAAVGPWRGVEFVVRRRCAVEDVRLSARVDGDDGRLDVAGRLRGIGAAAGQRGWRARVLVEGPDGAGGVVAADAEVQSGRGRRGPRRLHGRRAASPTFRASVTIPRVMRWWPHTHGAPARYRVTLEIGARAGGDDAGNHASSVERFDLGWVGFRDLRVDTTGGDFAVSVNGRAIFCRGACWTPVDPWRSPAGATI